MAKKKGKGRGWWGDSAGHAAAAKKSGGKGKKSQRSFASLRSGYRKAGGVSRVPQTPPWMR